MIDLNSSFDAQEVCDAIKQMNPTKAPGPDVFHSLFFQKYLTIVKDVIFGVWHFKWVFGDAAD